MLGLKGDVKLAELKKRFHYLPQLHHVDGDNSMEKL